MKRLITVSTISFSLFIFSLILNGCSKDSNNPTGPNQNLTATISGTVIDSLAGTPVAGATVTIGSQSASTDASGSYSLSSVPLGEQSISISAPGYVSYNGKINVSTNSQPFNFRLTAVKEVIPFAAALDPGYYGYKLFNLSEYSYYQCSGSGLGNHNVKITVNITSASAPVLLVLVRPDGYYSIFNSSTVAGFSQTITTNACGNWALFLLNLNTTQITCTGNITIDFSNYLPTVNDLLSTVTIPFNLSISSRNYEILPRFIQQGLSYKLELNISGGSNDIDLSIFNPDGNIVFNNTVSGSYNSQTFVATKTGLYIIRFDNTSYFTSRSVTGYLKILR